MENDKPDAKICLKTLNKKKTLRQLLQQQQTTVFIDKYLIKFFSCFKNDRSLTTRISSFTKTTDNKQQTP